MTAKRSLQVGDRVKVKNTHRWLPGRVGTIYELQHRAGNRIVVRFDVPELGLYREEIMINGKRRDLQGDPYGLGEPCLLRLTETDLELLEKK